MQLTSGQGGCDEAWEHSDSESETDIDSGSEVDTPRATPPQPRGVSAATPASELAPQHLPSLAKMLPKMAAAPSLPQRLTIEHRSQGDKTEARQAKPPQGLMGLVAHLRKDNERLREALVVAQREAEAVAAAAEQALEGDRSVKPDFAHLLALMKDFGDDLGGICAEEQQEENCEAAISIFTPRDEEQDSVSEAVRLRCELKESESTIAQLRASLDERDAEIARLRAGHDLDAGRG